MSQKFLLLTPLGRADACVAKTFREHGVIPLEISALPDYPSVATGLYSRKAGTAERARVQRAYEETWRARVADCAAELWQLDDEAFDRAWGLKPRLREEWPPEVVPFEQRFLYLRTFHLPDPPDVSREWAWLTVVLEALSDFPDKGGARRP